MKASQSGFTLIELVVVIVILGIVGAVATARFQNLAGDARSAAQKGIAAEIQSSASINYAEGAIDGSYTYPVTAAQTCAVAANSLLTSGVPSGWTVNTDAITGCGTAGDPTTNCTLTNTVAPILPTINVVMLCTG